MTARVHSQSMRNYITIHVEDKNYQYWRYLDHIFPKPAKKTAHVIRMIKDDSYRCLKQRESFDRFRARKEEQEDKWYKINKKFRKKLFGDN